MAPLMRRFAADSKLPFRKTRFALLLMVRSSVLVYYMSSNSGCCFHFESTTREYELYEHANAISESEVIITSTLERTISTATSEFICEHLGRVQTRCILFWN